MENQLILMTKIWLIPLIIYLAIVPFTPNLDITISRLFFDYGFIYKNNSFFEAMRIYGEKPAFITAGLALIIFLISFFSKHMRPYRESCLFIVLTLVVGAGLITNVLLKDHWGRPRPRQIVEFGGTAPFHPMYEPDFHNPAGKSFCSGHAAMGFFFFSLMITGWRRRNTALTYLGLFLALFMGISLSVTRIAQGAHFFSDVLTSAMVMWLSALLINWLVPEREKCLD